MRQRIKKFKDTSAVDFLVLRDKLGLKRYRKRAKRDKEKREILINLGLNKIEEKEKNDFILLGYKRRKLKI
jgi:DNA-directed RNA polymerase subunit N (RpoN/RPB10)